MPSLDVVRAFAILAVMCHHWLPAGWLVNRLQENTANGVHLFFVLSGFLITQILLSARDGVDRGSSTLGRSFLVFYGRRFLRIFPAYYLVLLLGIALGFPSVRQAIGWHAAYLSNVYYYRTRQFDGPASAFWTLSVEEQFYLVWPALVLLAPRRYLLQSLVATVAVGVVARTYGLLHNGWLNILTPACLTFLGTGGLLAHGTYTGWLRRPAARVPLRVAAVACGLVVVADLGAARGLPRLSTTALQTFKAINQTLMTYLFGFLILALTRKAKPTVRPITRPFVYLGRISYGVYLYHLFVSAVLARWTLLGVPLNDGDGFRHNCVTFPIRFVVTVAVASASWFTFERPINDLKRHLPY